MAGSFSVNGNGEMAGLAWIEETGELQTPSPSQIRIPVASREMVLSDGWSKSV
jgi:L-aminopeptidase/D-esterase-like protein